MSKHYGRSQKRRDRDRIAKLETEITSLKNEKNAFNSLVGVIVKEEWAVILAKLPLDSQKLIKKKLYGYMANIRIKKDISRMAQNLETMTFKKGEIEKAAFRPDKWGGEDVTVNWG